MKVAGMQGSSGAEMSTRQPTAQALPDAAAGPFLSRFSSGARFAASGIVLTVRSPRLLVWALVPMVVHVALCALFISLGAGSIDELANRWGPDPSSTFAFARILLVGLLWGGLLLVSLMGSMLAGAVVCDPFYDLLSETTESLLLGRSVGAPFSLAGALRSVVAELGSTAARFAVYLAVAVPLWLLGLTGVGSVISVPALLAWNWVFVALGALERSMARHGVVGSGRIRALFAQPACVLGFGAVAWMLATVPLTMPFLVVGGTRLYLALAAWGHVTSKLNVDDKRALRAAGA